jgi:hypothetical protein
MSERTQIYAKVKCPKCGGKVAHAWLEGDKLWTTDVSCGKQEVLPVPASNVFPLADTMQSFLVLRDQGRPFRVTAELYDYFLEVLPPAWMNAVKVMLDGSTRRCDFGFAEGWEYVVSFWKDDKGECWAWLTNELNPWR